jgi:hypothetical protein
MVCNLQDHGFRRDFGFCSGHFIKAGPTSIGGFQTYRDGSQRPLKSNREGPMQYSSFFYSGLVALLIAPATAMSGQFVVELDAPFETPSQMLLQEHGLTVDEIRRPSAAVKPRDQSPARGIRSSSLSAPYRVSGFSGWKRNRKSRQAPTQRLPSSVTSLNGITPISRAKAPIASIAPTNRIHFASTAHWREPPSEKLPPLLKG